MTKDDVCHEECLICATWRIGMCDMTHSYVWHDSFICVTWLIHMCDMTHYVWRDLSMCVIFCHVKHDEWFICATWLIHMCKMTHSYVWHNSIDYAMYVWHDIYKCAMSRRLISQVTHIWHSLIQRNGAFSTWTSGGFDSKSHWHACATWLIHMCDMTHSYVQHDSFICVSWLIHMCYMTHSYVWHDSFIFVTWLMTDSYVWHDSFSCVTWLIHMCDMTRS